MGKLKFSVIIPTIWLSNRTPQLLGDLNNCELVDEIILIDNNPNNKLNLSQYHKLKYHTKGKNIYVNPAWNWGVELAKNELIALCNDDINFEPYELFEFVLKNEHGLGVIGMHKTNFNQTNNIIGVQQLTNNNQWSNEHIGGGYGVLIFIKKSNWISIPNELKIWFGDNWIAKTNKPNYALRPKQQILTEMSTSSNQNEMIPILQNDIITWKRITE